MSCIAVSVNNRSASGATSRNDRPSGPSTVRTPSLVNSRYAVLSAPSGSRSSYSNSGTLAPLNTTISNNAMSNAATCSRIGPRYGRRSQRRTWLEVACVTFLELGLPRWVGAGAGHRDRGAGQRTLNSRQHVGQRGGPQALTSLDATQKLGIQEPGEQACHEGVSCTDGVDDLNRWGVNAGQLAGNAERDQGAGETAGYHRQRGTQLTPQPQHVRDRRPLVQPGDVLSARLDHVAETDDLFDLGANLMRVNHQCRAHVRVVGDGRHRACVLDRGEDRGGTGLKGCGDGTGVDVGQPLQRQPPGQPPRQVKAVCRSACLVQCCRCHGRRLSSDVALGERDPFICKVTRDLVTSLVVADKGGERDVVAQTGKSDGHVGRATPDVFLGGSVRALDNIDQRLADHERALTHVSPAGMFSWTMSATSDSMAWGE